MLVKNGASAPWMRRMLYWLDMKRAFDCVVAVLLLLMLCPLYLMISAAVVLGAGMPVFFCQRRVGRHGRDFTLYKFRTMRPLVGAEAGLFDAGCTTRVTSIGRFLRASKLDELPQVWNVLRGDMSLVGPRPEVRKWVDAYPERWAAILALPPGITDPASIEFRDEERILMEAADPEDHYLRVILPRKLAIYEAYLRSRSFRGDLLILLATVRAVLSRANVPASGASMRQGEPRKRVG